MTGEFTSGDTAHGGVAALFSTITALRAPAAVLAARRVALVDVLSRRFPRPERRAALVGALLADYGRVVLRLPAGEAPERAAAVLEAVPGLQASADAVRSRHERIDGTGLPAGLSGAEIPLGARVVALADLVVAQRRPGPIDWARRLEIMKDSAGTALDVELAEGAYDLLSRSELRRLIEQATPENALTIVLGALHDEAPRQSISLSAVVESLDDPADLAEVLLAAGWPGSPFRAMGVHQVHSGELLALVTSVGAPDDQWQPLALTAGLVDLREPTETVVGGRTISVAPIRCPHLWGLVWGVSDDDASPTDVLTDIAEALSSAVSRDLEQRELEALAHGDELTGLANRRKLEHELQRMFDGERAVRDDAALIMCDIDGLKRLNDTRGHAAGDELLRSVAATLRDLTTGSDAVVARLGGDEFCILLRQGALLHAQRLARSATAAVAASAPSGAGLSCGIAYAAQATSPSELLRRADEAQYLAKRHRPGRPRKRPVHERRRRDR